MPPDSNPVLRKISTSHPFNWLRISVFCGTLAIVLASLSLAWSNHFSSGFHLDDSSAIVNNRALRDLSNVRRFFTDPRTFSAEHTAASYQPLLSTSFALDYRLGRGGTDPLLFQIEDFVWMAMQLLLVYGLFRLIPWAGEHRNRDRNHYSALFAAALYGIDPLAAETVNYPLQRGEILAGLGVVCSLSLWIVWPRRLPEDFLLKVPKVPKTDWDMFKRNMQPRVSAVYRGIRNFPFPLYLVPVILAMLASPSAAVFAGLLIAYILIFEPETGARKALPACIVCGGYWLFQTLYTWKFAGAPRVAVASFWFTQPWAVVHYFYAFFVPFGLTSVSNLQPFSAPWAPMALAGYAGVAALVWLAVLTARRPRWQAVSFGLWWFLIATAQQAVIPRLPVEAYPRAWFAFAGLAFGASRTLWVFFGHSLTPRRDTPFSFARIAVPALMVAVLAGLGWLTWQRNQVWQSDQTLWTDVIKKNPGDGVALMNYGLALISAPGIDFFGVRHKAGLDSLKQAEKLLPNSAVVETNLAIACEGMSLDSEAETHYLLAIGAQADYEPAYAHYAHWLLNHQNGEKAMEFALRARQIDPMDLTARHVLTDIHVSRYEWSQAASEADAALRIDPADPDSRRAQDVAQAGLKAVSDAETLAKYQPTVDNYLALSVLYFHGRKYEDAIRADREALRLQPDLAEAWVNIATAYHEMNRTDDTIDALRKAVKLRPDLTFVKNNLNYELAHKAALDR